MTQCWLNAGPTSATPAQHQSVIGSAWVVYRELFTVVIDHAIQISHYCQHDTNEGSEATPPPPTVSVGKHLKLTHYIVGDFYISSTN